MKLNMISTLLLIGTSTVSSAQGGLLFNVGFSPEDNVIEILPVANHPYPFAGIRVIGVPIDRSQCSFISGEYCGLNFSASTRKVIPYTPVSNPQNVIVEVCANVSGGRGISCQKISNRLVPPILSGYISVGSYRDTTHYTTDALRYSSRNGGQHWSISHLISTLFVVEPIQNLRPPFRASSTVIGGLNGVSCDSTGETCIAVGTSYESSSVIPVGEYSTDGGESWTASSTQPSLPTGITSIDMLRGISCQSSGTTCVAVGSYYSEDLDNTYPVSYTTTDAGVTWTTTSGSSFTLPTGSFFKMEDVHCLNSSCVAVGSYIDSDSSTVPISYYSSDTGASWTASTSFSIPSNGSETRLRGVYCDKSTGQKCVAVGSYLNSTLAGNELLNYYTVNAGTTWVEGTLPSIPSDAAQADFYSVSCDSSVTKCMAVGSYINSTYDYQPLTYTSSDSGASWSATTFPTVSDSETDSTLVSVVCDETSSQTCTTVGWYGDTKRSALSFYTDDGGDTWTDTSPSVSGSSASVLLDVSCDSSATSCVAVGEYNTGSTETPLVYSSVNSGETLVISPVIQSILALSSDSLTGKLNDVSCSLSNRSCSTVGMYFPNGPGAYPLSYFSSNLGQSWTKVEMPTVTNMNSGELKSIACESTQCTTVGKYATSSTNEMPLSYISSNGGSSWITSASQPALPSSGTHGILTGVDCGLGVITTTPCSAVGYYTSGSAIVPLTYSSVDVGNHWTISATLPQGVSGSTLTKLNAVNCSISGASCVAVGSYAPNSAGDFLPVIYTTANGGVDWSSPIQVSLPPLETTPVVRAELDSIRCNVLGTHCLAVGSYNFGSPYSFTKIPLTYVSTDSGASWSVSETLPKPVSGGRNTVITGVTCDPTLTTCSAVGSFFDTIQRRTNPITYLSTDGGKNWNSGVFPILPNDWIFGQINGVN